MATERNNPNWTPADQEAADTLHDEGIVAMNRSDSYITPIVVVRINRLIAKGSASIERIKLGQVNLREIDRALLYLEASGKISRHGNIIRKGV